MSMICSEIAPEKIVEINIHDNIQSSFTVLDVFVQVACHIARGGTLEVIGKHNKYSDIVNFEIPENKRQDEGRKLVVFNSGNFLEIAVYKSNCATVGSASTLLGLGLMDAVSINFKPKPIRPEGAEIPQNITKAADY